MLSIYVCGAVITAFKSIKMLLLSVYFQILFIRRIQNRSPNLWFVEMIFNGIQIEFVLFKNVLKSFSVYISIQATGHQCIQKFTFGENKFNPQPTSQHIVLNSRQCSLCKPALKIPNLCNFVLLNSPGYLLLIEIYCMQRKIFKTIYFCALLQGKNFMNQTFWQPNCSCGDYNKYF